MTMQKAQRLATLALLAGTAAACNDMLGVTNYNQPELDRVFSTPAAIEQTIGAGYQSVHNSLASNDLMPEVITSSLESFSGLNNFNMGVRVAIPRSPIMNATGAPSIFDDFSELSRGGRLAANALNALDVLIAEDATPSDGILGSIGEDLRARAFAFFVIGAHQGWLALIYDQAGIVVPGMPVDEIPELSDAHAVMAAAIDMLDSAEAIALSSAAAPGFPLPDGWLGGADDHAGRDEFVRLVRSYRARFRAGVARTPTERAAVDWNAVKADATNGIESNWMVMTRGSTGWNIGFIGELMFQDGRAWSQISLMYFGMADTVILADGRSRYEAWLDTPLELRSPFLVQTPDRRWPRGGDRDTQVANSATPANIDSKPYIAALASNEISTPWGWSYYQFWRTRYIRNTTSDVEWPEMLKAEIDMLAAEAHLRLDEIPQAIALIDQYRTANDLPSLAGLASMDDPVPGADYVIAADLSITSVTPNPAKSNCVPRVPVPPAPGGTDYETACGSLWEAMKYTKRMETAYSSFGRWWIDGRGWGDLVENSNTEYPVPFQEMDARELPSYALGGGLASSAARGTYGF